MSTDHFNPISIWCHRRALLLIFCFYLPALLLLTSGACHPIDEAALLDFKSKITSDPSKLLRTWTPTADRCKSWQGIACDTFGRVVKVSRSGHNGDDDNFLDTSVSGILSPSLANISYLQLLDLSNLKDLRGRIPPEFGKLSRLTHLFLDTNKLTGSVPKIGLSENNLSGPIPSSVGKLDSLTKLDIYQNSFSCGIPKVLEISGISGNQHTKCQESRFCLLSENKQTGTIPASICNLRSIRRLIFENNKLTGKLPATIGRLSHLIDIFFANNNFLGKIPPNFANLRDLQTLDLSRNRLIGSFPPQLAKLQGLQTLDLSCNPLGPVSIQDWIQELKLLRLLLASTGLKGKLSKSLASSSIITLDLSHNALTGKVPNWIENVTALSFLNLSKNAFHSSIPEEFKNLSRLMDLDLHSNKFSGGLKIYSQNISMIQLDAIIPLIFPTTCSAAPWRRTLEMNHH